MHRTRSSTASQRSSVSMTPPGSPPATNNITHAHLSKVWKQARKWKAERDALHDQISANTEDETVSCSTNELSKAWKQARKCKAERDALHDQNLDTIDSSAGEVSKAWTQARKWKAERDANEKQLSKCDEDHRALLSCIWESRSEMPFWKQHEHPNHQHPIFRHLLAAGYKP